MKHDPEKKREPRGKGKGSLERGTPDRTMSLRKGQPTNMHRFLKRVTVQKGMPVITGIHPNALFMKREVANFGVSVRSTILNRLDANRRNEGILW